MESDKLFKESETCMIASNDGSHGFTVGTTVRISEVLSKGYKCIDPTTFDYWYVEESDLKLVQQVAE